MGRAALGAALALALLLGACGSPYRYADSGQPHHLARQFVNWGQTEPPPTTPWYEALWRRARGDFKPAREPEGGYAAFAAAWRVPLTAAQLQAPPAGQARVVWLGHASVLLQADGKNLLIDPQLSDFAGPLSWLAGPRRVAPPIRAEELPPIDAVLITHNHYDHLDLPTLQRLRAAGQRPQFLVPLGLKAWFTGEGFDAVEELDWWDTRRLGALTLTLLPAQHWSRRGLGDTNATLWGGWAVAWQRDAGAAPWRFVHTGDTAYNGALFEEIHRRLGAPVDFLAVPIGAYEPRDFMWRQHTNPAESVRVAQHLRARDGMAIHWGTFELSNEPFDQPPQALRAAQAASGAPAAPIRLLRQGEVHDVRF